MDNSTETPLPSFDVPFHGDAINRRSGEQETLERFINKAFVDEPLDESTENEDVDPENIAENRSDVEAYAKYRLSKLDTRLAKKAASLTWRANEAIHGPQGEKISSIITQRVEWVPLRHIFDDPEFVNVRLDSDPEKLLLLAESMKHEGLKVPITVISITSDHVGFYVRAGFRRTAAARSLGWKGIPAVILPANTPVVEEYWTNIIENTARSQLSSYETACAAQVMRDKFNVSSRDFAIRSGYSREYINNLLRCVDRLPQEVLDAWRNKERIPIDYLISWSAMTPDEALKMMLTYANRHPTIVRGWSPAVKRQRTPLIKITSTRGLQRMMKVRVAVECARDLDPRTRSLCLQIIDFCSGGREDVPKIYNPRERPRRVAGRLSKELVLPEPGCNPPPPSEINDEEDR